MALFRDHIATSCATTYRHFINNKGFYREKGYKKPKSFRSFYLYIVKRLYPSNGTDKPQFPNVLNRLIKAILEGDGEKVITSLPRRHSKTTTILICLAYICFTEQKTKSVYATYSDDLAGEASDQFDKICRTWAGELEGPPKLFGVTAKRTVLGNIVYFLSLRGSCTGKGANRVIVIDDPMKNEADAKSRVIRDTVFSNITVAVLSGAEFKKVNRVLCGTRFDNDDPQGRLIKRGGWTLISYPAIGKNNEKGDRVPCKLADPEATALWPELRPIDHLLPVLDDCGGEDSYAWQSLMQGQPPKDDFCIFSKEGVRRHSELPADWRTRITQSEHGIDLAYSKAEKADMSAFFTVHRVALDSRVVYVVDDYYVLDRVNTDIFFQRVKMSADTVYWYADSAEADRIPEILNTYKVLIIAYKSNGKLSNSQNFARLWRSGLVYVPDCWKDYAVEGVRLPLSDILGFTGLNGDPDDANDAIAAAIDTVSCRDGIPAFDMPVITINRG